MNTIYAVATRHSHSYDRKSHQLLQRRRCYRRRLHYGQRRGPGAAGVMVRIHGFRVLGFAVSDVVKLLEYRRGRQF